MSNHPLEIFSVYDAHDSDQSLVDAVENPVISHPKSIDWKFEAFEFLLVLAGWKRIFF
jgi:hypothetical protein